MYRDTQSPVGTKRAGNERGVKEIKVLTRRASYAARGKGRQRGAAKKRDAVTPQRLKVR